MASAIPEAARFQTDEKIHNQDSTISIPQQNQQQQQGSNSPQGTVAKEAAPVTSAQGVKKIWPGYIIGIWITLSSCVILQNAYIMNDKDLHFKYPIFLTTFHMIYATIGTRILLRTTNLLDDLKDVHITWDMWLKNIVPIGALFSASLIFSNMAYITLSVSFIQMLKAFTSVAVLGMSILMGLDSLDPRKFIIVLSISFGVALAAYGEIQFSTIGFINQCLGILFEAARLVSIQKLLSGLKMGPLVSLYYYAPVCAGLNLLVLPFFEGWAPFHAVLPQVGLPFLFMNATTAFLLNIAVVFLIGCASSLVLTLSGVLKDILLVAGAVIFQGNVVTATQLTGYSIALIGLFVFKTKQEVLDQYMYKIKSLVRSN